MAYQVIIIEDDQSMIENMTATLKTSPDFILAATFKNANAAIRQSGVFRPDLFLVNAEDAESISMLPAFVDLYPKADILGMMSNWVPDMARKAVEGGAWGCILKPFSISDITEALRLYKTRGKIGLANVIAFFSPKGRAGRTTLAAILALALAHKTGERVALIDADLQFGDLPIFFDVEPEHTIIDATQDIRLINPLNFEPYFHKIKDNLYLLSSPDKPEYAELVDAESLAEVVRMTCHLFKYVLIDLPAGFNPISIRMSNFADKVVVMAMINNGFEIQHMSRALRMFKSFTKGINKKIYPVFSRVNPCTDEEKHKIEAQLGYKVDEILPNEYKMVSIANSGRLSKGLPMDTLLMQKIDKIADDIISGKR